MVTTKITGTRTTQRIVVMLFVSFRSFFGYSFVVVAVVVVGAVKLFDFDLCMTQISPFFAFIMWHYDLRIQVVIWNEPTNNSNSSNQQIPDFQQQRQKLQI